MNTFFYILIFIMGICFGSFYTLAVYRIPRGENITHKHSYCPNCKHQLGFLDLIPVLSYIFLGGRCRYCKKKIRPRYLILELLSGLFFVLIAIVFGLNIYSLSLENIMQYVFFVLYFTFVVLFYTIYKETNNVNRPVMIYGAIVSIMYMIYLYIIERI